MINKHGKLLYKELQHNILRNIEPKKEELNSRTTLDDFLPRLIKIWEDHKVSIGMVKDISMYLDKNYVAKEKNLRPIYDAGIFIFRKYLIQDSQINQKFKEQIFSLIQKD